VSVLDDDTIRGLILRAWLDSEPGTDGPHEEGGFVLRSADGALSVERWPRGARNQIFVPPHPGGNRGGLAIVATFHTHPNPGREYQQEPGLTDIRAVRNDPDLSHPEYEGEYVIATESIYRIERNGRTSTVGDTKVLLRID
jgi:hypothetical protein